MKIKLNKLIMVFFLVFLLVLTGSYVIAHKSAASSSQSVKSYTIEFGKNPGLPVEKEEQQFFYKVKDKDTGNPVDNLRAEFKIYVQDRATLTPETIMDTSSAVLITEFSAKQETAGNYIGKYIFKKKGSYLLSAKLYDGEELISQNIEHVHVEPNSPSIFFLLYMVVSVILGAIIASKSHK